MHQNFSSLSTGLLIVGHARDNQSQLQKLFAATMAASIADDRSSWTNACMPNEAASVRNFFLLVTSHYSIAAGNLRTQM